MRAAVAQARQWADDLIRHESRGSGDTANAMRRVSRRYGIPFGALWALRYRPRPDVWTSIFMSLRAAYLAECERQMRNLEHEIEITKAMAGPDDASVRKAAAALAKARDRIGR